MRVLIIQPWIRIGGGERLSLHLSHELERLGHQAPIAALFVDREGLPAIAEGRSYRLPPAWLATLFHRSRALTFVLGPLVLLALTARASRDADVLNPHNLPAPLGAALVGAATGMPIVWQVNEVPEPLLPDEARALGSVERLAWSVGAWLARRTARIPARIVVLSEKTRADVLRRYRRDALVIEPGLDAETFEARSRPRPDDGTLRLLFVGKLHPQKRPERAIAVAALLARDGRDIRLTIVGDGPLRGKLERTSAADLPDRVTFRPRVSDPELASLYASSDVLLVTAGGHQSWGLVPFEALAAGTPAVVSADIGAAPILADREAALIVDGEDARAFADDVVRLHDDAALRARLVSNGRRLIRETLTWRAYAGRYADVLAEAAGGGAGARPAAS